MSTFKQLGGAYKISNAQKIETGVTNTSVDHNNTLSSICQSVSLAKAGGASTKMTKSAAESMPSLKIPEAVIAFAQAAARANGDPEKYLPGWPLLSPYKFQLQKCTKCSLEFCSPVNYKRHIRMHRKSNIHDKASQKSREYLAVFWDKISVDESRELVSLKDSTLMLEIPDKVQKVASSSIIARLASSVRKPGFSCLPQVYAKAGIALLDIIQANTSRLPISSQELFKLLDDASEKTFLCAGPASSLLRFLLDGDVENIVLDMKNLVACTGLLLELELFKAWHADKDAEALRCQKLLVEEEEAAQKRRVGITERRRRKKLRQKVQKTRDITGVKDLAEACDSTYFVESSATRISSDAELDGEESSSSMQSFITASAVLDCKVENDGGCSPDACFVNEDDHLVLGVDSQWDVRTASDVKDYLNGSNAIQIAGTKSTLTEKNSVLKNPKALLSNGGQKVWTRKVKHKSQEMKVAQELTDIGSDESLKPVENNAVLIGTISVSLGDCVGSNNSKIIQSNVLSKFEYNQNHSGRSIVKFWRPVSRQGNGDCSTCQNGTFDSSDVCKETTSSCLVENFGTADDGENDDISGRIEASMLERTENACCPTGTLWRQVSKQGRNNSSTSQIDNSQNSDVCKELRSCSGSIVLDEVTGSQLKNSCCCNCADSDVYIDRRDACNLVVSCLPLNKFFNSTHSLVLRDLSACQSNSSKSSDVCCDETVSSECNGYNGVNDPSLQENYCLSNNGDAASPGMSDLSMLDGTELSYQLLPSLITETINQRWNEAIASEHIKWVHTCAGSTDCPRAHKDHYEDMDAQAQQHKSDNDIAISVQKASLSESQKIKVKSKAENAHGVEYVTKQKQ